MRKVFILLSLLVVDILAAKADAPEWQTTYKQVESSMKSPVFNGRNYVITKFGASTKASAAQNQKAINKAIVTCSRKGGGRVVVPAGTWNTGALTLKSGVNLVVEKDARIVFAFDTSLYPLVRTRWEGMDCYNYQPCIYGNNVSNVGITGEGTIDGGASNDAWWFMTGVERFGYKDGRENCKYTGARNKLLKMVAYGVPLKERIFGKGYGLRPQLINIIDGQNILIEGVTLLRSPFWVIHPVFCKNLTVKNVHIWNEGPNGDGCDPESCDGVLIEGCRFHTGDDCIAIKSGRNQDGRADGRPSQNIIVRNCDMEDGHGGVVVGSEIAAGVRNVFVENCRMDSKNLERVIRIKSNPCRGGTTENIFVRNVKVGRCKEAVLKINLDYDPKEQCCRDFPPTVHNVWVENSTCEESENGVFIVGLADNDNIYDIHVRNCKFDGIKNQTIKVTGKAHGLYFE